MTRTPIPGLSPAAETAWRKLTLAATDTVPCCGTHAYRWTSDDPDDREAAAHQCSRCPIIELCRAYADLAGERHHVWAGVDRGQRAAKRQRATA